MPAGEPSPLSAEPEIRPAGPNRGRPLLIAAIAVALLLVAGAASLLLYLRWAKAPYASTGAPVRLSVTSGETLATVASQLESQHLIRSARVFVMISKGVSIHPGFYDISPAESPRRIASRLERGDIVTVRVTFPEGFTIRQMAHRLGRLGLCDEAEFYDLVANHGDSLKASFAPPSNLEGYLFPDTYRFPLGDTATQIAQRMLSDFDELVAQQRSADLRASGRSLADIVNVAAMVEREAEVEKDRPLIAGVIYNRLQRHMLLQIDATVQYALPRHKTRVLFSDLKIDSPYNTYRNRGLPPGPICCPGIESIDAALHPAKHDYLYYVAQPDRSHRFARTLEEHYHNIAMLRRGHP